jgi:hypothetical protein
MGLANLALSLVLGFLGFMECPGAKSQVNNLF